MRLFFGLPLPDSAKAALGDQAVRLCEGMPGLYVPSTRYHVTLAYLGERDASSLPALQRFVESVARVTPDFTLLLQTLAYFGRAENAILYAAPSEASALGALCDMLWSQLRAAGESFDDKPFCPHVTLARHTKVPNPQTFEAFQAAFSNVCFPCRTLTLFHSAQVRNTLCYQPIIVVPFSGNAEEEFR